MSTNADDLSLDLDEPHTPPWFTFLGLCLFLLGGIFLLATDSDDEASATPAAQPTEQAAAAAEPAAQPTEVAGKPVDPHAGHDH